MSVALLRKAARTDYTSRLWRKTYSGQRSRGRPCPICSQPMIEVAASDEPEPLMLDVCRACQFVWFDPDEFKNIPAAPPPPKDPDDALPPKAREALALWKVQQMAERQQEEEPSPDAEWKTIPAALGLPVESESTPLQHVPWVTWALALCLILIGAFTLGGDGGAARRLAMVPAEVADKGGFTLFSSFFVHGGWVHLLVNVYFLAIFGDNVEDFLGHWRFGALVLLATLLGNLAHLLGDPRQYLPALGASGGISGMIAFYALKFPRARLDFLNRYTGWLQVPVWTWFFTWVALQVWAAHAQSRGEGYVSALAHLGGALAGVVFWAVWRNLDSEPRRAPSK